MRRAGTTWTLDWAGGAEPTVGQVIRCCRADGIVKGYWRLTSVRLVKHRKPLPDGYIARYRIGVRFVSNDIHEVRRLTGAGAAWTLYEHPRKPKPTIAHDPFSPLLPEQQDNQP